MAGRAGRRLVAVWMLLSLLVPALVPLVEIRRARGVLIVRTVVESREVGKGGEERAEGAGGAGRVRVGRVGETEWWGMRGC